MNGPQLPNIRIEQRDRWTQLFRNEFGNSAGNDAGIQVSSRHLSQFVNEIGQFSTLPSASTCEKLIFLTHPISFIAMLHKMVKPLSLLFVPIGVPRPLPAFSIAYIRSWDNPLISIPCFRFRCGKFPALPIQSRSFHGMNESPP